MDVAGLNLGFGKDVLYRLGKALESIHTGNKDVVYTSILQLSDDLQPELTSRLPNSPEMVFL
jgi:hypothetical protein